MKKLRSKQKLIGGIAIILVVIILAIAITTNIIKNNSPIASEGYSTTTANENSNLVASYIKSGITIGGITGTLESLNTFDATALPEDILWGETAYVKGEKITGTRVDTVAQAKEYQKVFEENTYLRDDYGNRVKVPAGFKIAEDSATAVTGGVVIEDVSAEGATEYTKESQFVWVPVGDVITDNDGNTTTITLGRYTFDNTGKENLVQSAENWNDTSNSIAIDTYYKELASSPYGNTTAKNLENFIKKATDSSGYYIGRYEGGDALATTNTRNGNIDVSYPNNPITCKAGVWPYNFVNQVDCANLCRNMYNSSNFDSDLINSYAWYTTIVYIQKFSGDADYSRQNRLQNTLAKCGEAHSGSNYDVRCNIYDMAGNDFEWGTETSSNGTNNYVLYGGKYSEPSTNVSFHIGTYSTDSDPTIAPRPILYL